MAQAVKTIQKVFHQGLVGDAVQSLGVSTIVNVVDKKLGGKLTNAGVSIGQTLNGKPLTVNGTDVVTLMAVVGSPGGWLKKNGLMKAGIAFGVKKFAEAFDYIDPPMTLNTTDPRATNVTLARQQREMTLVAPFRGNY